MSSPSERIIGHMNKDHQLALSDYVVVYGDVNPANLIEESVQLVSVDEKQIVIDYDIIKPPITKTLSLYWHDAKEDENIQVKAYGDIKGKLIAMAKYCANEQGYAVKKLTKVHGPDFFGAPMYLVWLVLFVNAYDPTILRKLFANDALFNKLIGYLPGWTFALYRDMEKNAHRHIIGLAIAHLGEILFFTKGYLAKYRAPENQRWIWYVMNFFEGFPVMLRLRRATK